MKKILHTATSEEFANSAIGTLKENPLFKDVSLEVVPRDTRFDIVAELPQDVDTSIHSQLRDAARDAVVLSKPSAQTQPKVDKSRSPMPNAPRPAGVPG